MASYITDPVTNGKVVMHTTNGDIEIELFAKETPRACRNFVQHCLEGYYDETIFHRIVKGFCVQGGDPTGTGTGGESIYDGAPFPVETHQRLRFSVRGRLAMALSLTSEGESIPNSNQSQFFVTLDKCEWLDKKYTIFGKVVGDTIFNVLNMAECDVDSADRPTIPPRITSVEVLSNPFPDIVVTRKTHAAAASASAAPAKSDVAVRAVRSRALLSFGDEEEAEILEEDGPFAAAAAVRNSAKVRGKGIRAAHDVLTDDPRLQGGRAAAPDDDDDDEETKRAEARAAAPVMKTAAERAEEDRRIAEEEELRAAQREAERASSPDPDLDDDEDRSGEDAPDGAASEYTRGGRGLESAKAQARRLKRDILRLKAKGVGGGAEAGAGEHGALLRAAELAIDPTFSAHEQERQRYRARRRLLGQRESETLSRMEQFRRKLAAAASQPRPADNAPGVTAAPKPDAPVRFLSAEDADEEDVHSTEWMTHTLRFKKETSDLMAAQDDSLMTIDTRLNPELLTAMPGRKGAGLVAASGGFDHTAPMLPTDKRGRVRGEQTRRAPLPRDADLELARGLPTLEALLREARQDEPSEPALASSGPAASASAGSGERSPPADDDRTMAIESPPPSSAATPAAGGPARRLHRSEAEDGSRPTAQWRPPPGADDDRDPMRVSGRKRSEHPPGSAGSRDREGAMAREPYPDKRSDSRERQRHHHHHDDHRSGSGSRQRHGSHHDDAESRSRHRDSRSPSRRSMRDERGSRR